MKAFKKISSLILTVAVLLTVSCETEKVIFKGPYFVRFTNDGLTQKESHLAPVKIEIHNAGPAPLADVIINYTTSGAARQGIDYVINGTPGKVKIKSGEYFGYIEVQLINNSNNILESQDLVFSIQTIENNTDLQVGQGVSQIGRTFTLTIQDDCILGGDYYGVNDEGAPPVEGITVTSLDCQEYTLSNWDIYFLSFIGSRSLKFTDNGDNTITIPPQEDATLNPDFATIDGFGVVDPTTRIITMTVRLVDEDDQPTFNFQLVPN